MSKETFVIHPDYSSYKAELRSVIDDFDRKGSTVVDGDRNTIKKFSVGDMEVNVKKFKTPNAFQSLVYGSLRKGKARRSFEYAGRLISMGIGTPRPMAFYERYRMGLKESYYLSEHLDFDFEFRVLNHNPDYPDREFLLKEFAAFTFQLHEHGVNFLDHSPGNTLVKKNGPEHYSFYLIDLNRMRFESMNLKARMKNFRRMWLSKGMINTMAPVYAKLSDHPLDEVHRLMSYYSRKFQKKVNSKKLRRRKHRMVR